MPGRGDPAGRVQQHRRAVPAVGAAEHAAQRLRVRRRVAAAELGRIAARDPELDRIELVAPHVPAGDLADEVRAGGGELVEPAGAVDDEGAPGIELHERLGQRRRELGRVDAEDERPRSGGIRQRAEHVEHRTRRELAPHRRGVAHRRVMRLGEEEAEAELVDRALDPLRRQLEREAERLEHVRRARRRGGGAVSVLRDRRARRCRHERRRGRDVERVRAVAARADHVDEVVALRPDGEDVLAHRLGTARDLVRGLALEPKRDEEAADLRLRRLAAHDLVHHVAGLRTREVVPVEQSRERGLDHERRKFLPSSGPERRQHALGMELDAFDRQLAVADAHHLAVGRPGGDLELVRDLDRGERVVAAGLEVLRHPGEDALAVVLDERRLAVQERLRGPDLAAERLDDRLVAEADAERRHPRPEPADQLDRDARVLRTAGTGGDRRGAMGSSALGLLDRDRVVPEDPHLGPELLEQVHEVVGERVVVIEHQQQTRPPPGRWPPRARPACSGTPRARRPVRSLPRSRRPPGAARPRREGRSSGSRCRCRASPSGRA